MKKLAMTLAGFAGLMASPAHAALSVNLSLPSGTFGNESVFCASGSGVPCTFTESVTFTTSVPLSLLSASITTIAVGGVGSTSDINLTSVTLTTNGVTQVFTLSSLMGGLFEVGGLANIAFAAPGTHTLTVTGTTYGTSAGLDGSYSGTLTFAQNVVQSGVPEPATWLSMIAGFGAIGFGMRRQDRPVRRVKFDFR
jgi:PEP-CTERM motif